MRMVDSRGFVGCGPVNWQAIMVRSPAGRRDRGCCGVEPGRGKTEKTDSGRGTGTRLSRVAWKRKPIRRLAVPGGTLAPVALPGDRAGRHGSALRTGVEPSVHELGRRPANHGQPRPSRLVVAGHSEDPSPHPTSRSISRSRPYPGRSNTGSSDSIPGSFTPSRSPAPREYPAGLCAGPVAGAERGGRLGPAAAGRGGRVRRPGVHAPGVRPAPVRATGETGLFRETRIAKASFDANYDMGSVLIWQGRHIRPALVRLTRAVHGPLTAEGGCSPGPIRPSYPRLAERPADKRRCKPVDNSPVPRQPMSRYSSKRRSPCHDAATVLPAPP